MIETCAGRRVTAAAVVRVVRSTDLQSTSNESCSVLSCSCLCFSIRTYVLRQVLIILFPLFKHTKRTTDCCCTIDNHGHTFTGMFILNLFGWYEVTTSPSMYINMSILLC